jgi:hypothetical protein
VAHGERAQLPRAGRELLEAEVPVRARARAALQRLPARVLGLERDVDVGDRPPLGILDAALEHRALLEGDQRHARRDPARRAGLGLARPQAVARARDELLDLRRVPLDRREAHPGRIARVDALPVARVRIAAAHGRAAQAQVELQRCDRLLGREGQPVGRSPGDAERELALAHVLELERLDDRPAPLARAVDEDHRAARDEDRFGALEAALRVGPRGRAPVRTLARARDRELELELGQRQARVQVDQRPVEHDRRARGIDVRPERRERRLAGASSGVVGGELASRVRLLGDLERRGLGLRRLGVRFR